MPVILAFLASAVIHMSALLSDGWTLPNTSEPDELDVVLLPAPVPAATVAAATPAKAPVPKPSPKPITKPAPEPRPTAHTSPAVGTPAISSAPAGDSPAAASDAGAEPAPAPAAESRATDASASAAGFAGLNAVARLPASGQWRYTVTRGEGGFLIGQTIYTWAHDGQRYTASSRIETIGIAALFVPAQVTQESSGLIGDDGLRPDSFRSVQKKRTDVARLDRERGVVFNGERETALGDAAARVQDMLSMYFQLGLVLSQAATPPAEIALPIITGRKLDTYRFEWVGDEKLSRQFHDYATRHVRARNRDDVIDLWFTPELPLPVRLRLADRKGDVYEQWLDIPEKGFP